MPNRRFKFTERDSELLVDLYEHRFLTIGQIQRLHFPSMQTAYRRLRLLKATGYVTVFTVANIPESIYTNATQGLQAVAEALGVERELLKWSGVRAKPRDYYFMRHFLAINDFRITLRQACAASGVRLLGFIPDYYGEKTNTGAITKYIRDVISDVSTDRRNEISHTPDGVFALERGGKAALFFLEIDRGTEVVGDPERGVMKSLRFYAGYLLDGVYQRYAKDFGVLEFKGFRSLYVTTSEARLTNVRHAAGRLPVQDKAKRFSWLTTIDRVAASTLFGPIWRSLDPTDERKYQIG